MSQAIKRSEIDNGPATQWVYPAEFDPPTTLTWFNTYLAPYVRYSPS